MLTMPGADYIAEMSAKDAGATLRSIRRAAGLTQQQLAERLNLTQAAISSIEVGKNKPTSELVDRWGTACGFDVVVNFHRAGEAALAARIAKVEHELSDDDRRTLEHVIALLERNHQ